MLLSFRDIRDNRYHVETTEENGSEFFCITSYEYGQKHNHEKLERLPSRLYKTTIRAPETHHVAGPSARFQDTLLLWHDQMGHPRTRYDVPYPQSISWASLKILSRPSALQSIFPEEVEHSTFNYKDYSRPP
ncbi:hypothetical protein ACFX1T_043355 [Malus domestica]